MGIGVIGQKHHSGMPARRPLRRNCGSPTQAAARKLSRAAHPVLRLTGRQLAELKAAGAPITRTDRQAPPGWYPDPVYSWRIRWFDGQSWTFHTRTVDPDGHVPVSRPGRVPQWATRQLNALQSGYLGVSRRRRRVGSAMSTLLLLVCTTAVLAAGVLCWQLWGTGIVTAQQQQQLSHELSAATGDPRFDTSSTPTPPPVASADAAKASAPTRSDWMDEYIDPAAVADGIGFNSTGNSSHRVGSLSTVGTLTSSTADGTSATTSTGPHVTPPAVTVSTTPVAGSRHVPVLPVAPTAPVGRIRIPAADVNAIMVLGADDAALAKGPGVLTQGVAPGAPGNATIAAHRTSHAAIFENINRLQFGDKIYIDLPGQPTAVFEVRGRAIVSPDKVAVTAPTKGVRLTLIACHPLHSTDYRFVVQAELIEGAFADQALPRDIWRLLRA